jgi:hypothetical protein
VSCDGRAEILTAGNLLQVKPVAGPYDASRGAVSVQAGDSLVSLNPVHSGFEVAGASRAIVSVRDAGGDRLIIVARNNAGPKVFRIQCPAKP